MSLTGEFVLIMNLINPSFLINMQIDDLVTLNYFVCIQNISSILTFDRIMMIPQ